MCRCRARFPFLLLLLIKFAHRFLSLCQLCVLECGLSRFVSVVCPGVWLVLFPGVGSLVLLPAEAVARTYLSRNVHNTGYTVTRSLYA